MIDKKIGVLFDHIELITDLRLYKTACVCEPNNKDKSHPDLIDRIVIIIALCCHSCPQDIVPIATYITVTDASMWCMQFRPPVCTFRHHVVYTQGIFKASTCMHNIVPDLKGGLISV